MSRGGMLGILDSLTGGEVIIILAFALLILGPERLPDTARTLGQWIAKIRSMTSNLQSEVREVLDDPAMQPIREVGEFVAAPRKKLMEYATAAEAEVDAAKVAADEAAQLAASAEAAAAQARAAADHAAEQVEHAEEQAAAVAAAVDDADEVDEVDGGLTIEEAEPESAPASISTEPGREASIWFDLDGASGASDAS